MFIIVKVRLKTIIPHENIKVSFCDSEILRFFNVFTWKMRNSLHRSLRILYHCPYKRIVLYFLKNLNLQNTHSKKKSVQE